jgi:hypothetical protein
MKLYLIVGTYTEFEGEQLETEWLLVARETYPEYDEQKQLLEDHIIRNTETLAEDFDIVDCWTNQVDSVNNLIEDSPASYKVTLTKE